MKKIISAIVGAFLVLLQSCMFLDFNCITARNIGGVAIFVFIWIAYACFGDKIETRLCFTLGFIPVELDKKEDSKIFYDEILPKALKLASYNKQPFNLSIEDLGSLDMYYTWCEIIDFCCVKTLQAGSKHTEVNRSVVRLSLENSGYPCRDAYLDIQCASSIIRELVEFEKHNHNALSQFPKIDSAKSSLVEVKGAFRHCTVPTNQHDPTTKAQLR